MKSIYKIKSIKNIIYLVIFFMISTLYSKHSLAENVGQLRITNNCRHRIKIAIMVFRWVGCPARGGPCEVHYEDGWWYADPYRTINLASDDVPIMINSSSYTTVNYYAESVDGSNWVWKGTDSIITATNPRLFLPNGSRLPYKAARVRGSHEVTLTCN